jgi:hypothetical protein
LKRGGGIRDRVLAQHAVVDGLLDVLSGRPVGLYAASLRIAATAAALGLAASLFAARLFLKDSNFSLAMYKYSAAASAKFNMSLASSCDTVTPTS